MRAVGASLILATLTTGCAVKHQVTIRGADLIPHIATLRARGAVAIPATLHEDGKPPRATQETIRLGQRLGYQGGTMTVEQLIDGCGDTAAGDHRAGFEPSCMLIHFAEDTLAVRGYTTRSVKQAAAGAIFLSALGGLIAAGICESVCREDSTADTASEITLGTAGALFGGLIVWMFIDCAGRWGSPGCRD